MKIIKWSKVCLSALCFSMLLMSCGQAENNPDETAATETKSVDLPVERETVSSKPVASYDVPLPKNLNNWHFTVTLTETKERFRYIADMQYQEVTASDTITFPNFRMEPEPQIKKGDNDLECIIGFLDKKKEFREYIKVFVEDDQLRVKKIKSYAVYEK